MADHTVLANTQRWVIKIGSSLITNDGQGLDTVAIQNWAEQISNLREAGKEIIVVASGAVAEGMARLGWSVRPNELHELQAAAAVGQMGLIQHFEACFNKHDIHSAQVLLTHEDLSDRRRYLNSRSTLRTLLSLGAIPIINENDTVATDEIQLGDNDTLAALVTNLVAADMMIILTDQDGMFDKDPRSNDDANLIQTAKASDTSLLKMAGSGSAIGRGGMATKITAAQRAARSGATTIICSGAEKNCLSNIATGDISGTILTPDTEPMTARKQWLANQLSVSGSITIDQGAEQALTKSGVSLLSVGVTKVDGTFHRGDLVRCVTNEGKEIARGLVNYESIDANKIIGKSSKEIKSILGYSMEPELIHRDNLVLLES